MNFLFKDNQFKSSLRGYDPSKDPNKAKKKKREKHKKTKSAILDSESDSKVIDLNDERFNTNGKQVEKHKLKSKTQNIPKPVSQPSELKEKDPFNLDKSPLKNFLKKPVVENNDEKHMDLFEFIESRKESPKRMSKSNNILKDRKKPESKFLEENRKRLLQKNANKKNNKKSVKQIRTKRKLNSSKSSKETNNTSPIDQILSLQQTLNSNSATPNNNSLETFSNPEYNTMHLLNNKNNNNDNEDNIYNYQNTNNIVNQSEDDDNSDIDQKANDLINGIY